MALECFSPARGNGSDVRFFQGALLCFIEARELRRKNVSLFVDLKEMHLLSKFHADRKSLRRSNVKMVTFSAILNIVIFLKNS